MPRKKKVRTTRMHIITEGLLDLGKKRNGSVNEILVNAMKNGIVLGHQLMIENGEVK